MAKLKMEIEVEYDSVTYDGTNMMDVYNFAKNHNLLESDVGDEDNNPGLCVRPADVPHLEYDELLKWWESTGEIVEREDGPLFYNRPKTYNTHNSNNMPFWKKGEDFYLAVKSANEGYLNREFFHKGDSIITYGHCVEVAVHVAPEKIPTYVKNRILDRYDMFHY